MVDSEESTFIGAAETTGAVAGMKVLRIENAPTPACVTPRILY
jgi:hypothetical protein